MNSNISCSYVYVNFVLKCLKITRECIEKVSSRSESQSDYILPIVTSRDPTPIEVVGHTLLENEANKVYRFN